MIYVIFFFALLEAKLTRTKWLFLFWPAQCWEVSLQWRGEGWFVVQRDALNLVCFGFEHLLSYVLTWTEANLSSGITSIFVSISRCRNVSIYEGFFIKCYCFTFLVSLRRRLAASWVKAVEAYTALLGFVYKKWPLPSPSSALTLVLPKTFHFLMFT